MLLARHIWRHLRHKRKFPDADVKWKSYITPDSTLGRGAKISHGSSISHSHLGERASVEHDCEIAGSQLGENVAIKHSCRILNSQLEKYVVIHNSSYVEETKIGAYTYFGWRASVCRTTVGRFCSIASDVTIAPGIHPADFVSTCPIFFSTYKQCGVTFAERSHFAETAPVSIGHDVWIGSKVFISDGVTIGNGAIIGAGAVVTKDVPPYAIVGGVPAKIIRYRFDEQTIEKLLSSCWWDWPEEMLRERQPLFVEHGIAHFLEQEL